MKYITECLIDGTRIKYDDCCSGDKYLQKYLQNQQLRKIGEGHIIYINGVENVYDELHHFFVRTNKNEEKSIPTSHTGIKQKKIFHPLEFLENLLTI